MAERVIAADVAPTPQTAAALGDHPIGQLERRLEWRRARLRPSRLRRGSAGD